MRARVARRGVVIKDHLREGPLAGPTLRLMDWVGNRGHDVRLPYNYLSRRKWTAISPVSVLRHCDGSSPLAFIRGSLRAGLRPLLLFVATVAKASTGQVSRPSPW